MVGRGLIGDSISRYPNHVATRLSVGCGWNAATSSEGWFMNTIVLPKAGIWVLGPHRRRTVISRSLGL